MERRIHNLSSLTDSDRGYILVVGDAHPELVNKVFDTENTVDGLNVSPELMWFSPKIRKEELRYLLDIIAVKLKDAAPDSITKLMIFQNVVSRDILEAIVSEYDNLEVYV